MALYLTRLNGSIGRWLSLMREYDIPLVIQCLDRMGVCELKRTQSVAALRVEGRLAFLTWEGNSIPEDRLRFFAQYEAIDWDVLHSHLESY